MADEYIKRDTAINEAICAVYWALNQHGNLNGQVIIDRFNAIPSADVVKVKHGEWIETIEHNGWVDETCAECSECGEDFILGEMGMDDIRNLFLYCPNCGARMDGEGES